MLRRGLADADLALAPMGDSSPGSWKLTIVRDASVALVKIAIVMQAASFKSGLSIFYVCEIFTQGQIASWPHMARFRASIS